MAQILIADDNAAVRSLMREILEDEGHAVVEAAGGPAALATLRGAAPMVAVLDLLMPGLDGIGLIEALHCDEGGCPHVLILSTAARLPLAEEQMAIIERCGATVLAKPFDLEDLLARVAAALEQLDASRLSNAR